MCDLCSALSLWYHTRNEYYMYVVPLIRTLIPPVHGNDTIYICSLSDYSKWGSRINDKGYRLHKCASLTQNPHLSGGN